MYYNFQTEERDKAVAALLLYATYRSRDKKKFKIDVDLWGRIERAVKSTAKRSRDLDTFLERLKPKLNCPTIVPRWAATLPQGVVTMKEMPDGSFMEVKDLGQREFLVDVLADIDHKAVLDILYQKAALVVLLVRDRLEREKNYLDIKEEDE